MKRIIVCVKPVPDPRHWDKVTMDPDTLTLNRDRCPNILNPLDKNALEAALRLQESTGAEIILLSMAPPFTKEVLREGLAMGADRAVLLSDTMFAGSDSLGTAYVLAAGCKALGEFDLLLMGNQSLDGSTAQVCSQVAELLGLPNVMHCIRIAYEEDHRLLVTRKVENGIETLATKTPAVISVRKEINTPRLVPFTGVLEAQDKELKMLTGNDIEIGPTFMEFKCPTTMLGMELRVSQRKKEILRGTPEEIANQLVKRIQQIGI